MLIHKYITLFVSIYIYSNGTNWAYWNTYIQTYAIQRHQTPSFLATPTRIKELRWWNMKGKLFLGILDICLNCFVVDLKPFKWFLVTLKLSFYNLIGDLLSAITLNGYTACGPLIQVQGSWTFTQKFQADDRKPVFTESILPKLFCFMFGDLLSAIRLNGDTACGPLIQVQGSRFFIFDI